MSIDLSLALCFSSAAADGYDFVAVSGTTRNFIYDSCFAQDRVSVDKATFRALVEAADSAASAPGQFTEAQLMSLRYLADNPPAFNLSIQDGALISLAIVGVWVTAWGFKALGHFFNGGDSEN